MNQFAIAYVVGMFTTFILTAIWARIFSAGFIAQQGVGLFDGNEDGNYGLFFFGMLAGWPVTIVALIGSLLFFLWERISGLYDRNMPDKSNPKKGVYR